MNNKDQYIKEVEKQMADWQSDKYKLKIIAEDAGWEEPDRLVSYYQVIEKIADKEKEIAEKLSDLKNQDSSNWQEDKVVIDGLRKKLADVVEKARYNVN